MFGWMRRRMGIKPYVSEAQARNGGGEPLFDSPEEFMASLTPEEQDELRRTGHVRVKLAYTKIGNWMVPNYWVLRTVKAALYGLIFALMWWTGAGPGTMLALIAMIVFNREAEINGAFSNGFTARLCGFAFALSVAGLLYAFGVPLGWGL